MHGLADAGLKNNVPGCEIQAVAEERGGSLFAPSRRRAGQRGQQTADRCPIALWTAEKEACDHWAKFALEVVIAVTVQYACRVQLLQLAEQVRIGSCVRLELRSE